MEHDCKEIQSFFDKNIRPKLAAHHGDVRIEDISEDGVVSIKLLGECSNCPSAAMTTEYAIKDVLLPAFPSLKDVVLNQSVSQDLLAQARAILFDHMMPDGKDASRS